MKCSTDADWIVNTSLRLTYPFCSDRNTRTSERVEPQAFQQVSRPDQLLQAPTPGGTLHLICRVYQVCSVESCCHGRSPWLQFSAVKSRTTSKRSVHDRQFRRRWILGPGDDINSFEKSMAWVWTYQALSSGEATSHFDSKMQQGNLCIQLPHMLLVVVHEKFLLAILHKENW
jgi:hypothetical protein